MSCKFRRRTKPVIDHHSQQEEKKKRQSGQSLRGVSLHDKHALSLYINHTQTQTQWNPIYSSWFGVDHLQSVSNQKQQEKKSKYKEPIRIHYSTGESPHWFSLVGMEVKAVVQMGNQPEGTYRYQSPGFFDLDVIRSRVHCVWLEDAASCSNSSKNQEDL